MLVINILKIRKYRERHKNVAKKVLVSQLLYLRNARMKAALLNQSEYEHLKYFAKVDIDKVFAKISAEYETVFK